MIIILSVLPVRHVKRNATHGRPRAKGRQTLAGQSAH